MNTIRKQAGFTLIELMIVIAIIAILLAIAVPAYQDYSIRAKNSECVNLAAGAKLAVSETHQSEGVLPGNDDAAGWSFTATPLCATIIIGANGVITATTTGDFGATATAFTFTPDPQDGGIAWDCEASAQDNLRQVPAECRP